MFFFMCLRILWNFCIHCIFSVFLLKNLNEQLIGLFVEVINTFRKCIPNDDLSDNIRVRVYVWHKLCAKKIRSRYDSGLRGAAIS